MNRSEKKSALRQEVSQLAKKPDPGDMDVTEFDITEIEEIEITDVETYQKLLWD